MKINDLKRWRGLLRKEGVETPVHPILNKAGDTTLYIYDEISYWGVSAESFVKALNELKGKDVDIRVNSPGGSVFDGMAIYNAIKGHDGKTTIHVDGLAASIAGIFVLAGDELKMAEGAFLMYHEPWSIMSGSADDFRKEAELLDKIGGTIADIVASKTGQDVKDVLALMKEETWLNAQEAVDGKYATSITKDPKNKQSTNLFDLSLFNKVPEGLKERDVTSDPTIRDCEKALTDIGVSLKQAKEILAKGFKASEPRDAVAAPAEPPRDVVEPVKSKPTDRMNELEIRKRRLMNTKK